MSRTLANSLRFTGLFRVGSISTEKSRRSTVQAWNSIQQVVAKEARIKDESSVYSPILIFIAILVALCCGLAAFLLHLFVGYAGCLGGVNGCHDHLLLDALKPLGIGTSLYFIISCPLSGMVCSLILYSPCCSRVTSLCKGGGGGHTKILVASGTCVSGWIAPLRILLAAIYMGGGNPLGTEGPIIHLSVSLATWLVSKTGRKRRKFFSTFAVIGAAAGISAGFNVLVTGFVYVIEELTRTLSRKLALILAFAAAIAVLFKEYVEKFLHMWLHGPHASLVPSHSQLARLSDSDIEVGLVLCIPIGILMGFAGWLFTRCAWALLKFLNPGQDETRPIWFYWLLPQKSHLALAGLIIGCLGAIGYETSGMNGVWGTTVGAIPEAIEKRLGWGHLLLLFTLKFAAFILATAAGGPGGLLVPSLATGGLLALVVGRIIDVSDDLCAACAVIGMGSMFASVMHMPLTGVIIIFELTRAENLMLHVVIANFIASNIVARLPHGEHSFVHLCLDRDQTWHKLKERDFIETDDHEHQADLALFVQCVLLTDEDRVKLTFERWVTAINMEKAIASAYAEIRHAKTEGRSVLRKSRTALFLTVENSNADLGEECAEIVPSPNSSPELNRHKGKAWTSPSRLLKRSLTQTSVASRDSRRSIRKSVEVRKSADVLPGYVSKSTESTGLTQISKAASFSSEGHSSEDTGLDLRTNSSGRLQFTRALSSHSHVTGEHVDDHNHVQSPQENMTAEQVEERKHVRDQWALVSEVIPDLNMRIWNALTYAQRNALCSAVEMLHMSSPRPPDVVEAPGMFLTPVNSMTPISGKVLRQSCSGNGDLVKVLNMESDENDTTDVTPVEAVIPQQDTGWKVCDVCDEV